MISSIFGLCSVFTFVIFFELIQDFPFLPNSDCLVKVNQNFFDRFVSMIEMKSF